MAIDAIVNRSSRMAIVRETVEGDPVAPGSGNDFIALQEGYEMSPQFNTLENEELTGTIAGAKAIQGLEEPSSNVSHYLRHSGVEGTEPNFGLLLEAAMGGKSIRATERDTIGGSTAGDALAAAVLKLDAGEGVEYQRGDAVLGKDSVNGYFVRNVESIATDDLSLNFNLDAAPALGVNLGKNVLYLPADEDHPSLSVWLYRGNGGDVEMMSGGKVVDISIDIPAADLINASFSVEGIKFFMNPIEIDATNDSLDFNDGGAQSITIPQKFYRDSHEMAAAVQSAMDGASSDAITVAYNDRGADAGKFTTATDGASLSVDWSSTANSLGPAMGYTADDTGSLSYVSDDEQSYSSPYTPVFDAVVDPLVAKSNEILLGGFNDFECLAASNVTVNPANEKVDLLDVCSESGKSGSLFSSRAVPIEITAYVEKHDIDKWRRFRENENTSFMYNAGRKAGGNWVAGSVVNLYAPTATISEFSIDDQDGVAVVNMTITPFSEDAQGDFYMNLL